MTVQTTDTEVAAAERAATNEAVSRMLDQKLEEHSEGLDDFLSKVDNVAALISGMNNGTIKPDQVPVPKVTEVKNINKKVITKSIHSASGAEGDDKDTLAPRVPSVQGSSAHILSKRKTTTATDYKKWDSFDDGGDGQSNPPVSSHSVAAAGAFADDGNMSVEQRSFMASMEEDSRRRSESRRRREQNANQIKERGNACFKKGDFSTALDCYTAAIKEANFVQPLYTNRALTYIKLGKGPQALADCDTALRLDPSCTKAFVNRASAYQTMGDYEAAEEAFDDALKTCTDSTKREHIETMATRTQLLGRDNARRSKYPASDPVGVLVHRVTHADTAGSDLIHSLMKLRDVAMATSEAKIGARIHGGLAALSNLYISGVKSEEASTAIIDQDAINTGMVAMAVLTALCEDDGDNAFLVAQDTNLFLHIQRIFAKEDESAFMVPVLKMLEVLAGHAVARRLLARVPSLFQFVAAHIASGLVPRQSHHLVLSFAANAFVDAGARKALLSAPAYVKAMETIIVLSTSNDLAIVELSLRVLANVCMDADVVRVWRQSQIHKPFLCGVRNACGEILKATSLDAESMTRFGTMVAVLQNVSTHMPFTSFLDEGEAELARDLAAVTCLAATSQSSCRAILQGLLVLFSRLASSVEVCETLVAAGIPPIAVALLDDRHLEESAIRLLAISTKNSDAFKKAVKSGDAGRIALVRILSKAAVVSQAGKCGWPSTGANAALIISHIGNDVEFAKSLVPTSIVASLVQVKPPSNHAHTYSAVC